MKITSARILAALAILAGLSAAITLHQAFSPDGEGRPGGGVLHLAFPMPVLHLNAEAPQFGPHGLLFPFLHSFLVTPLPDGGFAPDLAERWSVSPDGRVWTFHLNRNARFHNGRPVRSGDVADSLKGMLESNPGLGQVVEKLETPEPDLLVIRLARPWPNLLYLLALEGIRPGLQQGEPAPNGGFVGSGPFRLTYQGSDRRLLLFAVPDFHGGRPLLDGIDVRYEPDREKIWIDFMNGELQACFSVSPENARFMRLEPEYYRLQGTLARAAVVMLFNTRKPPFDDRRVRKALALMLDVPRHIVEDLDGMAEPCPGPLGANAQPRDDRPASARFDPKKAVALLAGAGWADHDGDGYLDRDGQMLEFELLVPLSLQMEKNTARFIQRSLNRFGVRAWLKEKRFDDMVAEDLSSGLFDACLSQQATPGRRPSVLAMLWSSSEDGVGNFGGYAHPEADAALAALKEATSREELSAALSVLDRRLVEDQPAVWLYHRYDLNAYSRRLVDMTPVADDYYVTFPLRAAGLIPKQDLAH